MRSKALGSTDWHRNTKRIRTSFITLRQNQEFEQAVAKLREKYFPAFKQFRTLEIRQEKVLSKLTALPRQRFGKLSFNELFLTIIPNAVLYRLYPPLKLCPQPAAIIPTGPRAEILRLSSEIAKELPFIYRKLIEELIELDVREERIEQEVRIPKQVLRRFSYRFQIREEDAKHFLLHDSPYVLTYKRKKLPGKSKIRGWWRKRWAKSAGAIEKRNLLIVRLKNKNPKLADSQIADECSLQGYDVELSTVRKVLSRSKKQTRR